MKGRKAYLIAGVAIMALAATVAHATTGVVNIATPEEEKIATLEARIAELERMMNSREQTVPDATKGWIEGTRGWNHVGTTLFPNLPATQRVSVGTSANWARIRFWTEAVASDEAGIVSRGGGTPLSYASAAGMDAGGVGTGHNFGWYGLGRHTDGQGLVGLGGGMDTLFLLAGGAGVLGRGGRFGVYATAKGANSRAGYFRNFHIPTAAHEMWGVETFVDNALANDGTGYGVGAINSGAIMGYNWDGARYTFGVAGWNNNQDDRCAGVFGGWAAGSPWGALGYRASGLVNHGVYGTTAYGTGTGKNIGPDHVHTDIGGGFWGDLFGTTTHGRIYGLYSAGERYAFYSHGDRYTDGADIHLQDIGEEDMAVFYTHVSTGATVMTSGIGTLTGGTAMINFERTFQKVLCKDAPVIVTVTPVGPSNGLYISSSDQKGATVVEANQGKSNVQFNWIAIGKRAGFDKSQLPREVIASDYTEKISRGLHNDANTETDGEGLYFQNGKLVVGIHPSLLTPPVMPRKERPKEVTVQKVESR